MRKPILILISLLALAFVIRVININQLPLYGDELTAVQDAHSILKTGMDQSGKFLPLNFAMRGGSPPGSIYLSIPFVWLFGPTALGIRAASLISGVVVVFLMYLLTKKLFSEKTALVVALLASISPWGISLSRAGFETNLALALSLTGVVLFLYSSDRPIRLLLGTLCFGLAMFTYPTYKLTIPVFLPLLFWYLGGRKYFWDKNIRTYFLGSVVVFVLFLGLLAGQVFLGQSEGRFLQNNIFAQRELREQIIQKINLERTVNAVRSTSLIFHNKPVEYFNILKDSYINYFSADFLFLKGDGNPRHNMMQTGVLYFVEIAFIFAAIYFFAAKKEYAKQFVFILIWLGVAPMAGALLGETHALRASFMLPPLLLLSGVGAAYLMQKNKALLSILALIIFVQFVFALERLYLVSPSKFANFWSYPAKRASQIALENRSAYDYIFVSSTINDSEYAYPVYTGVDPNEVIKVYREKTLIAGIEFKKFGNVYIGEVNIGSLDKLKGAVKGSALYVLLYDPKATPEEEYKIDYSLDGTAALVLIKN